MKNALLLLLAAALTFSCKKKEEVKPEVPQGDTFQLLGSFPLDGNANDASNNVNAAATDVTFGATTATFNGTSSFIRVPANGTFTTPDQLSISLFFKATYNDPSQEPRLLQLNDETGHAIELYLRNSRLVLVNWDENKKDNVAMIMTPDAPDLTMWHKVVIAINFASKSMSLYMNDNLVQTVNNINLTKVGNSVLVLGRHQHPGTQPRDFYRGELDNVSLYERILTPADFPQIVR